MRKFVLYILKKDVSYNYLVSSNIMENVLNISRSQEDYLKLIWHLNLGQKKATIGRVAELRQVTPPTASSMFQLLEKRGYIEYEKSNGAILTEVGDSLARKLVRKHRLVETFLQKVLQLDDQLLHEEAERLEHVISDILMQRIDAYLGFPEKDPHGSFIPAWGSNQERILLNKIRTVCSFRIVKMNFSKEESSYYHERGLKLNSIWSLTELGPDQASFLITNGKKYLALSPELAGKLEVIIQA